MKREAGKYMRAGRNVSMLFSSAVKAPRYVTVGAGHLECVEMRR